MHPSFIFLIDEKDRIYEIWFAGQISEVNDHNIFDDIWRRTHCLEMDENNGDSSFIDFLSCSLPCDFLKRDKWKAEYDVCYIFSISRHSFQNNAEAGNLLSKGIVDYSKLQESNIDFKIVDSSYYETISIENGDKFRCFHSKTIRNEVHIKNLRLVFRKHYDEDQRFTINNFGTIKQLNYSEERQEIKNYGDNK